MRRHARASTSSVQTACAWDAVWRKASGHCAEFLNFDKIETYKDFGGIRIEDDILITKDGCRFLGEDRIPYHPKDVEAYMAENK